MIAYSPSMGRHVPLRDLPLADLLALAKALGDTHNSALPTKGEILAMADQVVCVYVVLKSRRDVPIPPLFGRLYEASMTALSLDRRMTPNEILFGRNSDYDVFEKCAISYTPGMNCVSFVHSDAAEATGYVVGGGIKIAVDPSLRPGVIRAVSPTTGHEQEIFLADGPVEGVGAVFLNGVCVAPAAMAQNNEATVAYVPFGAPSAGGMPVPFVETIETAAQPLSAVKVQMACRHPNMPPPGGGFISCPDCGAGFWA